MTLSTPAAPRASGTTSDAAVDDAPGTSRPLRRDAARNRDALLAAANEVFAERGLEATLDEVARRAGLGVGTAYRHFANKHELARVLMEHRMDEIVQRLEAALAEPDALAALIGFVQSVMAAQSCDVGLRQVMLSGDDRWAMESLHERLEQGFLALARRAQDSGQLRDGVEPTDFGMVLVMLGAVGDLVGGSRPDLWRRYFAACMDGLCRQAGQGGRIASEPSLDETEFREALVRYKATHY